MPIQMHHVETRGCGCGPVVLGALALWGLAALFTDYDLGCCGALFFALILYFIYQMFMASPPPPPSFPERETLEELDFGSSEEEPKETPFEDRSPFGRLDRKE